MPVVGPGGQRTDGSEITGVSIHVQTAITKSEYLEYLCPDFIVVKMFRIFIVSFFEILC